MEISLADIFVNNFKIIGENGTYPQTDNCYVVEVSSPTSIFTNHYFPKPVYHMIEAVKNLGFKLENGDEAQKVSVLIENFNNWGEYKYNEASSAAVQDNM